MFEIRQMHFEDNRFGFVRTMGSIEIAVPVDDIPISAVKDPFDYILDFVFRSQSS